MNIHRPNLLQELQAKTARARQILDGAEGRSMSRREKSEFDRITAEAEKLGERLVAGQVNPRLALGQTPRLGDRDSTAGELLRPEQRVADWVTEHRGGGNYDDPSEGEFSLGRCIGAMVRGNHAALTDVERRALSEGSNATGGFLIPEPLSAVMIDRMRNASRVFQAGATTVPMTVDQLLLARLTGGASVAWKAENAAIADSSMTFDRLTLNAKTLPILVKISQELMDDLSPAAAGLIENEMAAALALELDRVVLRGSGVGSEPTGIRNASGVTITSMGTNGAQFSGFDNLATAIGVVRSNNGEPNAAILSARTETFLDKQKDSTGQSLQPPPSVRGINRLVSNQIPDTLTQGSSSDTSEAYVAQWDNVLVGLRTDVRVGVRVLDQRYADNLMVGLLAYLRADVVLAHPELMVVLTGIKP